MILCKQTLCSQMMRLSIQRNIYVNVFSKAKAKAYMKALPKRKELKISDEDWHSEGID